MYKSNWKKVVEIVQECFKSRIAPRAFKIGTLVIIPKDEVGGVRWIGLLETINKICRKL